MIRNPDPKSQRRRRAAHIAWAVIAITVSLVMIFTKLRGDPPLFVFVPLVWIFWIVGHFVILTIQWLAARGQRMVSETGAERKSWPTSLRITLIGTGVPALIGIYQFIMTVLQRKWYPYHDAGLWATMLAVWLVHGICFAGLLLRQQWSRLLSAVLAFGWALLLASQIAEHLSPRVSSAPMELLIAFLLMVILLLFGLHLVASRKVKSFFTP